MCLRKVLRHDMAEILPKMALSYTPKQYYLKQITCHMCINHYNNTIWTVYGHHLKTLQ